MDKLDTMMQAESDAGSPCVIRIVKLDNGTVRARMIFAPGMETVHGDGQTVAQALTNLASRL